MPRGHGQDGILWVTLKTPRREKSAYYMQGRCVLSKNVWENPSQQKKKAGSTPIIPATAGIKIGGFQSRPAWAKSETLSPK
jgi:hypothetical protein